MDSIHDTSIIEEEGKEDRKGHFPDEIIHHIFSFFDMKYAVQTSTLSHKFEHIWKSTEDLNLNSCEFRKWSLFAKFVKELFSHRNNDLDLSKVQLTVPGSASRTVVKSILNYAYVHNVRELNMTWVARKFIKFPECLFSSHTLKHLTLATSDQSLYLHPDSCIPQVPWDFPALETVCLRNMHLGNKEEESVELFSKCVNLQDITLHKCCMYGLSIFTIYAPELSNLTMMDVTAYPDVLNVFAPKLENLTANVKASVNRCPFEYESLQLLTDGFDSLEKVNLFMKMPHYEPKRFFFPLLNLFRKLRGTKYLVLNLDIIETLSLCLDQLSYEPCPFDNLTCLKITMASQKDKDHIATVPTQVRKYLLENSPNATFIMNLPQVPQVDDEKMGKLKAVKKEPGTVAQEKRMLEANIAELPPSSSTAGNMAKLKAEIKELPPSRRLSSPTAGNMAELKAEKMEFLTLPRLSSSTVPQKRSLQHLVDEKMAAYKAQKRKQEAAAQKKRMLEANRRHPSANVCSVPDLNL